VDKMNIVKIFKKILINTILGAVLLAVINFVGIYFNFNIALNVYSALIIGILGVPGLILLILLKFMI
jgi:inhibitor of the pro-sigma K processing machinery